MQAATNVESLSAKASLGVDAIGDAEFLRQLVAFGFEYAKLNPTQLVGATEGAIDAFLATLWQGAAVDSLEMRQATGKFSKLFEKQDTLGKQKQALGFEKQVLKSAGNLPWQLQEEKHSPRFLSALVELTGTYTALKPHIIGSNSDHFLESYWNSNNQKGTEQLISFLSKSDNSVRSTQLLEFESGLFDHLISQIYDDTASILDWGTIKTLTELMEEDRQRRDSYGQLTTNEVNYAREIFGDSIDYSQIRITKDNIASVGATKTLGNTIHFQSTWGSHSVFESDGTTLTPAGRELLIHEMTHVWQYQNGDWRYATDSLWAQFIGFVIYSDRDAAYNWREAYNAGLSWETWNPEQQAAAVEEYNRLFRSGSNNAILMQLQPYIEEVRQREGALRLSGSYWHLPLGY